MTQRLIQYELEIDGVDVATFRVAEFHCHEALFDTYRATVGAVSREPSDPDGLIGKTAALRMRFGDDTERVFHGVIVEAELDAPRRDLFYLRVQIAPKLELLRLGRECRMFQSKSVKDVVTQVLADGGVPADAAPWETTGSYKPREYIVQSNESDYDFVTRLLHDEGIGFAVRNETDMERVVFFDDSTQLPPIEGDPVLWERDGTNVRNDTVSDLRDARVVASDEVMLRDYDFRHPSTDLSANARAPSSTGREVYAHHGGFMDAGAGKKLAQNLLQKLRLGTRVLRGRSDCPRLEPGRKFSVDSHARADVNGDLLLVSVTHRGYVRGADGAEVTYECEFTSVPQAVPYRPLVAPAQPAVGGVQVAFITVPSGEEIHPDEHGRVKVRFPWDRSGVTDDKSSTWLRVGQLALGGSMTLPRVDFETVIDFELGDLDRPFITGHLYNGELRVPYELPANKTRSSIQTNTTAGGGGANELRFEDSGGGEEIFMNASKDMTVSVENDTKSEVVNNATVSVGSNNTLSVGTDHNATVGGSRTLDVGANQDINVAGDYTDGIGGSHAVSVGGMRKVQAGGDHAEQCGGALSRTVGALQCVTAIAGYARTVVGDSSTTVGAAWLEMAAGSRMSEVGGSRKEMIGALKFIKAKDVTVAAGGAYTLGCASMSVKCGGSRNDGAKGAVAITSGSGISVKAKGIVIEAQSKLAIIAGPAMIKLSSGGDVTIKAPKIDLTGVKNLAQLMHKSNP